MKNWVDREKYRSEISHVALAIYKPLSSHTIKLEAEKLWGGINWVWSCYSMKSRLVQLLLPLRLVLQQNYFPKKFFLPNQRLRKAKINLESFRSETSFSSIVQLWTHILTTLTIGDHGQHDVDLFRKFLNHHNLQHVWSHPGDKLNRISLSMTARVCIIPDSSDSA